MCLAPLVLRRTTLTGLRLWHKETAIRQQMLACAPIELDSPPGDLETAGQGGAESDSKPADGQLSTCSSAAASGASPLAGRSLSVMRSFRAAAKRQALATEHEALQPAAEQPAQLRLQHSRQGHQFFWGTSLALRHTLRLVATGQCEEAHLAVDEAVCLPLRR